MEPNITKKNLEQLTSTRFSVTDLSCDEHDLCAGQDYIEYDGGDAPRVARCRSTCSGTLVLESDCGIRIAVTWYAKSEEGSFLKAFDFTLCEWGTDLIGNLHGAILVDEHGIALDDGEASAGIEEVLDDNNWRAHVRSVLPVPPITLLDENGDENDQQQLPKKGMSEFYRSRLSEPSIQFIGKLLASVESSPHPNATDFSGRNDTWTVLELFALESSARVCVYRVCSKWSNIEDYNIVSIAKSDDEVCAFFGDDWLEKALYKKARIKCGQRVRK